MVPPDSFKLLQKQKANGPRDSLKLLKTQDTRIPRDSIALLIKQYTERYRILFQTTKKKKNKM